MSTAKYHVMPSASLFILQSTYMNNKFRAFCHHVLIFFSRLCFVFCLFFLLPIIFLVYETVPKSIIKFHGGSMNIS